jgi:hypothetical protein
MTRLLPERVGSTAADIAEHQSPGLTAIAGNLGIEEAYRPTLGASIRDRFIQYVLRNRSDRGRRTVAMEWMMSKTPPSDTSSIPIVSHDMRQQALTQDAIHGKLMANLCFFIPSSSDRERDLWLDEATFRYASLSKLLLHLGDHGRRHGRNLLRGAASHAMMGAIADFRSLKPRLFGAKIDCRRHVIDICTSLSDWFKPVTRMTLELDMTEPVFLAPRESQGLVLICLDTVINAAATSLGRWHPRLVGITLARGSDGTPTLTLTDTGIDATTFPSNPLSAVIGNVLSLLDCERCVRATQCGGLRLTIRLDAEDRDHCRLAEPHVLPFEEVLPSRKTAHSSLEYKTVGHAVAREGRRMGTPIEADRQFSCLARDVPMAQPQR